jgi:hypothetical protein
MSERGFYMDFEDFDKNFEELVKSVSKELVQDGLFDAATALLEDADEENPQTPYKTGDLRSKRQVEKAMIKGDKIEVKAGYNMEYAARVHEGEPTWKWTTTQVSNPGPKFLEKKLFGNAKKYMQIVADYIRQKLEERHAS